MRWSRVTDLAPTDRLEKVLRRLGVGNVLNPTQAARFACFAVVGITGIFVDIGITASTITAGVDYLFANAIGYSVAVTWNFALNYRYTWNRPNRSVKRMYAEYLSADIGLFAGRIAVVWLLVEVAAIPDISVAGQTAAGEIVASLAGILAVALATFVVADRVVFEDGDGDD